MLEDMDGNLIPLEGNMQIQVDEATGTLYLEEGGYEQPPPDAPAAAPTKGKGGSGGRKAKQQKKPLQVVVGPDGNPIKKRGQTELKCMEKGCSTSACNVGELRKHLMVRHSLHFDEEVIQFPNEEGKCCLVDLQFCSCRFCFCTNNSFIYSTIRVQELA